MRSSARVRAPRRWRWLWRATPRIVVHVRLDERSAGFFALGASKATGRRWSSAPRAGLRPPSSIRLWSRRSTAGVALLVCTADRPPRLQRCLLRRWSNRRECTDQPCVWSASPGVPSMGWERVLEIARFAGGGRVPLRPDRSGSGASRPGLRRAALRYSGRAAGGSPARGSVARDRTPRAEPDREVSRTPVCRRLVGCRVLFVVGVGCGPPESVLACRPGARRPGHRRPAVGLPGPIDEELSAAADAMFRDDSVAAVLRPDLVVRLGGLHASKVLAARLHEWSKAGTRQLLVDQRWRWPDPDRDASTVVRARTGGLVRRGLGADTVHGAEETRPGLVRQLGPGGVSGADRRSTSGAPGTRRPQSPASPAACPMRSHPRRHIVVSSSMPIRDLEWYAPPLAKRILSNRGANGIDGVVSTALGAAATGGRPVVAVVGDLAFLHDLTAWVGPRPEDPGPWSSWLSTTVVEGSSRSCRSGTSSTTRPSRSCSALLRRSRSARSPEASGWGGRGIHDRRLERPRSEMLVGTSRVVVVKAPIERHEPGVPQIVEHDAVTARVEEVLGCSVPDC